MEKSTPHCKLSVVKALIASGDVRITQSALRGAAALGMDAQAVIAIVIAMPSNAFYKSMTSHVDHRVWQDVYHPMTAVGAVYLKLTVVDDVLIVSFKEL